MTDTKLDKLISEALAIEAEEAKEAGALGYTARALTLATLPHRQVSETEFRRQNGAYELVIFARSDIGIPFGSIPKLLIGVLPVSVRDPLTRERLGCPGVKKHLRGML